MRGDIHRFADRSFWDEPHDGVRTVRGATIYRRNGTWRSRWLILGIAATVSAALFVIAWQLRDVSTGRSGQSWGRVVACGSAIPLMITFGSLIVPRTSLRIGRRGLQHVTMYPWRRRTNLPWDSIERVRWGKRGAVLRRGGKTIYAFVWRHLGSNERELVQAALRSHLDPRFDLEGPIIGPTSKRSTFQKAVYALVAAHVVIIPFAAVLTPRMKLSLMLALIVLTLAVMLRFTLHERKADWRYPRESGERRW